MNTFPKSSPSSDHPGESEIIEKLKAGDKNSFVVLVADYRNRIASMAYTFAASESERDDLVQEGYIALYNAALTYNGKLSSFSTYATVCMRNRMLNWVMKNINRTADNLSLSDMDENTMAKINAVQNNFEDTVIMKAEIAELMRFAKQNLSPREYEVFDLYAKGYTNPEICNFLSIDKKSCENALFRIRTKLKALRN